MNAPHPESQTDPRIAFLARAGILPHRYFPGQMKNRLTMCADCGKAEAYVAHDADLPREKRS